MQQKDFFFNHTTIHLVHTEGADFLLNDDFLKQVLSPNDAKMYHQIAHNKRKTEFAAVRYLLYEKSLKDSLFYDSQRVPFLKKEGHISISHSSFWVGIALCKKHRIGFDLEFIQPKVQRVYDKFAHPLEFAVFPKSDVVLCTLLWSFKETVYKIMRTPGLRFAEDVVVEKNEIGTFVAKVNTQNQLFLVPLGFEIIDNCVMTYNAANVEQIQ